MAELHQRRWFHKSVCIDQTFSSLVSEKGLAQAIASASKVLKHDRTTTVVETSLSGYTLIIKRYNARSVFHRFKRALRQTRARRCWQISKVLDAVGLNVARNILMFEKRFGVFRGVSYYVVEKQAGSMLIDVAQKLFVEDKAQFERVLGCVRSMFQTFEHHRLFHGDMKATNLLWDGSDLILLDLDAAGKSASSWMWRRANAKDKRRFLKNWQHQPELLQAFTDALES